MSVDVDSPNKRHFSFAGRRHVGDDNDIDSNRADIAWSSIGDTGGPASWLASYEHAAVVNRPSTQSLVLVAIVSSSRSREAPSFRRPWALW
jgi:hypothetical protein